MLLGGLVHRPVCKKYFYASICAILFKSGNAFDTWRKTRLDSPEIIRDEITSITFRTETNHVLIRGNRLQGLHQCKHIFFVSHRCNMMVSFGKSLFHKKPVSVHQASYISISVNSVPKQCLQCITIEQAFLTILFNKQAE